MKKIPNALTIVLLTLFGMVGASDSIAESPDLEASDFPIVQFSNCGLNAFVAAFALMGESELISGKEEEIQKTLRIGKYGERQVTMANLQAAFSFAGIPSVGVSGVNSTNLFDVLGKSACTLLHIQPEGGMGHFVSAVKEGEEVVLVDYPRIRRLSIPGLKDSEIVKAMSGKALLVKHGPSLLDGVSRSEKSQTLIKASAPAGKRLGLASKVDRIVDSGRTSDGIFPKAISVRANERYVDNDDFELSVKGIFPLDKTVEIVDVQGACGCFKNAEYRKIWKIGEIVEIDLVFDRSRFPWSSGTSIVVKTSRGSEIVKLLPKGSESIVLSPKDACVGFVSIGGISYVHQLQILIAENSFPKIGSAGRDLWIVDTVTKKSMDFRLLKAVDVEIAGRPYRQLSLAIDIPDIADGPFFRRFTGGEDEEILFQFTISGIKR